MKLTELLLTASCGKCRHSRRLATFPGLTTEIVNHCPYKIETWRDGMGELCKMWLPVRKDLAARLARETAAKKGAK